MLFVLSLLFISLLSYSVETRFSESNLRLLSVTPKTQTNSTAYIVSLPKCTSDADCSGNGKCNTLSGECVCDREFATYVDPGVIQAKSAGMAATAQDTYTQSNTTSFTVLYKVVHLTTDDVQFCNYKKKSQLTALMLSLFVGFGAEHFYLENYKSAAAKIVFTVACCGINIVYFIFYKCVKDGKKYVDFIDSFQAFYLSCGFLFMVLWTIYDCVNIGFDKYTDGNGVSMLTWN